MELSEIDKVQTVKKIHKKEATASAKIEDTLSISSEAQKKADWVDKIKKLPDIRPEKIEAALGREEGLLQSTILAEVALKIQSSF